MRVLMVADVSAEKVIGGAERMLVNHVRVLIEGGHTVSLLTRQPQENAELQLEIEPGVMEYRLSYSGHRSLAELWQLRKGAGAWWRQHADEFDMVVAEQPFTMWALLQAGCRLPRMQVVHSLAFEEYATRHGLDWGMHHWLIAKAMHYLEAQVYKNTKQLIVLSQYMRHRLQDTFGLAASLIDVVPGGVNVPQPISDSLRKQLREKLSWTGYVVVTVRNLVPRTGVDLLVQAAGILRYEMPEIRWCVIGDGVLLESLRGLAQELNLSDRVTFTGYLPEEAMLQHMQAADAFMLPTRSLEGFGLVTVEANACGLPVVATPVGANPEVVASNHHNRLARETSPQALAEALQDILSSSFDHQARAEELREHCSQHFGWKLHDEKFLRLTSEQFG